MKPGTCTSCLVLRKKVTCQVGDKDSHLQRMGGTFQGHLCVHILNDFFYTKIIGCCCQTGDLLLDILQNRSTQSPQIFSLFSSGYIPNRSYNTNSTRLYVRIEWNLAVLPQLPLNSWPRVCFSLLSSSDSSVHHHG